LSARQVQDLLRLVDACRAAVTGAMTRVLNGAAVSLRVTGIGVRYR
jgi:hypothetical protein